MASMVDLQNNDEKVPSSLAPIIPILRVANEIQPQNPRVAFLCHFHAYERAHYMDTNSTGCGVRQFKTSLMHRLEMEEVETTPILANNDPKEIQLFYQKFYEENLIDDVYKKKPEEMAKIFQTALVLYEVQKTVVPPIKTDEKTERYAKDVDKKKEQYEHYNILPLYAAGVKPPIMEFPEMEQRQQLLHFCDSKHPLVYLPDNRGGATCHGCQESIYCPSYGCPRDGCPWYYHHKSCAEVPLGLHHPLHPLHPLILFDEKIGYLEKENSRCQVCNESRKEYTYRCYRCDFNLHIKCAIAQLEAEFHNHPLTPFGKSITFTCDICGKEGKGVPNLCATCCFWIHRSCASFPRRLKVVRHRHPLHLTHSSLELRDSDPRFCQLCVQKVDTCYGLYYCSKCDFIAHLKCAINRRNREDINLLELKDKENEDAKLDQSVESAATYKVKNSKVVEDGTEIPTKIEHFSHKHDLKLTDEEVYNNEKCDGCIRAISPPFYSCAKCSFFLHKSCANLPMKKKHPLHQHPLTLQESFFGCFACGQRTNGFVYSCKSCWFELDVQCSLVPEILTHEGHKHQLILSYTDFEQSCSSCGDRRYQVFRCTACEFALDFKCAKLPQTTRYKQHEHPFTLNYAAEDDSGEYYCDICEEERNPSHWFYYCANCTYPAHPKCILEEYPNKK